MTQVQTFKWKTTVSIHTGLPLRDCDVRDDHEKVANATSKMFKQHKKKTTITTTKRSEQKPNQIRQRGQGAENSDEKKNTEQKKRRWHGRWRVRNRFDQFV